MDEISKVVERAIIIAAAACKRSATDRAKAIQYLREMADVLRLQAPDHAALTQLQQQIDRLEDKTPSDLNADAGKLTSNKGSLRH